MFSCSYEYFFPQLSPITSMFIRFFFFPTKLFFLVWRRKKICCSWFGSFSDKDVPVDKSAAISSRQVALPFVYLRTNDSMCFSSHDPFITHSNPLPRIPLSTQLFPSLHHGGCFRKNVNRGKEYAGSSGLEITHRNNF